VSANKQSGISIAAIGAGSSVQGNRVFGSGLIDMTDEVAACGTNSWSGNTFQSDEAGGIPDGGPMVPCIQ
jgi:hypothetical protein